MHTVKKSAIIQNMGSRKHFSRHKIRTTLSGETLSGEIFVGRNYSSGEIFVTKPTIRHFCPTKSFARQKVSPKRIFYFSYHYWTMDYNSNNTRSKNSQILPILAKMTAQVNVTKLYLGVNLLIQPCSENFKVM